MRYTVVTVGQPPSRFEQLIAFGVRWAILSVAVWVAAELVGGIHLGGWQSTLIVALILGLLNAVVKPVLFVLSCPLLIVTLGLFLIVLNAFLLWLTDWIASHFEDLEFQIDHFWWDAIWGAIIISLVSWAISLVVNPEQVARRLAH